VLSQPLVQRSAQQPAGVYRFRTAPAPRCAGRSAPAGASAAVVAANLNGFTGRRVNVLLTGGELLIEWKEDNHVYMTGPAVEVFEGSIKLGDGQ